MQTGSADQLTPPTPRRWPCSTPPARRRSSGCRRHCAGLTFSVDDDVLQLLATGCRGDRRDRAGHRHRLRRPGVARPRVLPRHRRLHRGGAVRRSGRPGPRFRHHRDPGLAAGRGGAVGPRRGLVAPLATRLRGLYLAIVTLGLVFIGQHVFNEWTVMAGPPGIGRPAPVATLFGYPYRRRRPVTDPRPEAVPADAGAVRVFALLARNLARSRIGRALTAIRDRDIAAA